jgi:hypothetical protein
MLQTCRYRATEQAAVTLRNTRIKKTATSYRLTRRPTIHCAYSRPLARSSRDSNTRAVVLPRTKIVLALSWLTLTRTVTQQYRHYCFLSGHSPSVSWNTLYSQFYTRPSATQCTWFSSRLLSAPMHTVHRVVIRRLALLVPYCIIQFCPLLPCTTGNHTIITPKRL